MKNSEFKKLFLHTINNQDNPFHPLVWINGSPVIGEETYIGGFSEINAKGAKVVFNTPKPLTTF